ncbi:MAG: hypothetical protein EOP04_31675, partial [Proteobacteria bacterium]
MTNEQPKKQTLRDYLDLYAEEHFPIMKGAMNRSVSNFKDIVLEDSKIRIVENAASEYVTLRLEPFSFCSLDLT